MGECVWARVCNSMYVTMHESIIAIVISIIIIISGCGMASAVILLLLTYISIVIHLHTLSVEMSNNISPYHHL